MRSACRARAPCLRLMTTGHRCHPYSGATGEAPRACLPRQRPLNKAAEGGSWGTAPPLLSIPFFSCYFFFFSLRCPQAWHSALREGWEQPRPRGHLDPGPQRSHQGLRQGQAQWALSPGDSWRLRPPPLPTSSLLPSPVADAWGCAGLGGQEQRTRARRWGQGPRSRSWNRRGVRTQGDTLGTTSPADSGSTPRAAGPARGFCTPCTGWKQVAKGRRLHQPRRPPAEAGEVDATEDRIHGEGAWLPSLDPGRGRPPNRPRVLQERTYSI